MMLRVLLGTLCFLYLFHGVLAQVRQDRQSAWEILIRENPSAVDDPQVSWKERLILYVLTPEQTKLYYQGADPRILILEDGQTLQQYLDKRMETIGSLFFPLPTPCSLFSLEGLTSDKSINLRARGMDLSQQGGSPIGCGIPKEATAMMIQLQIESLSANPVRVKLWPLDEPEPAVFLAGSGNMGSRMGFVRLSPDDERAIGDFQISVRDWAALEAQVIGYFRRSVDENYAGNGISFYTESASSTDNDYFGYWAGLNATGSNNSFFGNQAGAGLTPSMDNSGDNNSFFGNDAGKFNTSGNHNSFFGNDAGIDNTTGNLNSFFGALSGASNTMGAGNAFFGYLAGAFNTGGTLNAYFGRGAGTMAKGTANSYFGAYSGSGDPDLLEASFGDRNSFFGSWAGSQNTSGSYNSFFGEGAGYSNTVSDDNSYFGSGAGLYATGTSNSFFGRSSGEGDDTNQNSAEHNSFFGWESGFKTTTGGFNSFFGSISGHENTTGYSNTFFGRATGYFNDSGFENAFFGRAAGNKNVSGSYNSYFGFESGKHAQGQRNAFFGYQSGWGEEDGLENTGSSNTFFGYRSGYKATSGASNTFVGNSSGASATVESSNTLIGAYANFDPGLFPEKAPVVNATAIGYQSYVSRSNSLILGSISGVNRSVNSVNVGIGTTAPDSPLHVVSTSQLARVILAEHTGSETPRNMMLLKNNGVTQFLLEDSSPDGDRWQFGNTDNGLNISLQGSGSQEFLIENDGDVWINNGTVMVTSYRASKENFRELDSEELLQRIAELPLSDWNYKKDADTVRHIGPVSEDFFEVFGYGEDDQHISPNDLAGVNTAAIQGLYQRLLEKDSQLIQQQQKIRRQNQEIINQETRIERLENQLTEFQNLKRELSEIRLLLDQHQNRRILHQE
jgi:hypothetical protein